MHFNQLTLLGHVTREPELRFLPNQTPVAEFGMAVNRKFKRSNGTEAEKVLFIDCRLFGEGAKVIHEYIGKGAALFVQGKLDYETWEDRETGAKRSKHLLTVETFQFVGSRPQRDGDEQQGQRQQQRGGRR